jgi:hypothetical protein
MTPTKPITGDREKEADAPPFAAEFDHELSDESREESPAASGQP